METKKISFEPVDLRRPEECRSTANPLNEPQNVLMFRETVTKMAEQYKRKNHDYGDSYAKSVEELGIIGGVTPIFNKCNRLVQLAKGEPALVRDETMEDTLLDMASYCIMLKIALDDRWRQRNG